MYVVFPAFSCVCVCTDLIESQVYARRWRYRYPCFVLGLSLHLELCFRRLQTFGDIAPVGVRDTNVGVPVQRVSQPLGERVKERGLGSVVVCKKHLLGLGGQRCPVRLRVNRCGHIPSPSSLLVGRCSCPWTRSVRAPRRREGQAPVVICVRVRTPMKTKHNRGQRSFSCDAFFFAPDKILIQKHLLDDGFSGFKRERRGEERRERRERQVQKWLRNNNNNTQQEETY